MKLAIVLTLGLGFLVAFGSPGGAQPVPDHATGTFSAGECGGEGMTVLVNSKAALVFETHGTTTEIALTEAEWAAGSVVLKMEEEADELVLPPVDSLKRCASPPAHFFLVFAEAASVFGRLDEFEERCFGEEVDGTQCTEILIELIDVSEDGEISQAEFSRGLRAVNFFVFYDLAVEESGSSFVPLEELVADQLTATLLGPLVAASFIGSYDYDGDGLVSPDELAHDFPAEVIQGVLATVPGMMSALIRSGPSLFRSLRR